MKQASSPMPLDLHVLGLQLAFILSQDQTLHCKISYYLIFCLITTPNIFTFSLTVRIFYPIPNFLSIALVLRISVYVNLSKNSFFLFCSENRTARCEWRLFLVCGCKGRYFFYNHQIFPRKNFKGKSLQRYEISTNLPNNMLNNIVLTYSTPLRKKNVFF